MEATSSAAVIDPTTNNNPRSVPVSLRNTDIVVLRHDGPEVSSLNWSPTMDSLAFLSDSNVHIWRMTKNAGQPISCRRFELRGDDFTCIGWNPNGSNLATGDSNGLVRIWSSEGGFIKTLQNIKGPVTQLKWNKIGSLILAAKGKTTVVWDVESGNSVGQFQFHTGEILCIDWYSETSFACGSVDKCIYVLQLGKNAPIKFFQGHADAISIIKWDPQGLFLASFDNKTLKIWVMDEDSCVREFSLGKLVDIKWSLISGTGTQNSNISSLLATASESRRPTVNSSGQHLESKHALNAKYVHLFSTTCVDISPSGKFFACGSLNEAVIRIFVRNGNKLDTAFCFAHTHPIRSIAWNHKEDLIGASCTNGSIVLLDWCHLKNTKRITMEFLVRRE